MMLRYLAQYNRLFFSIASDHIFNFECAVLRGKRVCMRKAELNPSNKISLWTIALPCIEEAGGQLLGIIQ